MRQLRPAIRNVSVAHNKAYDAWVHMRNRCNNPNSRKYKDYGGRGISVCTRWDSFTNFIFDMGLPKPGYSIERIDNEKGYYKDNCEWATAKKQSRNKRNSKLYTHDGKTMNAVDWGIYLGAVNANSLVWGRLFDGWTEEEALTIRVGTIPRGTRRKKKI